MSPEIVAPKVLRKFSSMRLHLIVLCLWQLPYLPSNQFCPCCKYVRNLDDVPLNFASTPRANYLLEIRVSSFLDTWIHGYLDT